MIERFHDVLLLVVTYAVYLVAVISAVRVAIRLISVLAQDIRDDICAIYLSIHSTVKYILRRKSDVIAREP
jgi:hypothetical protein